MAKFYREGKKWAQRPRYKNNDLYASGDTQAEVAQTITKMKLAIDKKERPKGLGADQTTLAQALQDYAMARLPFKKGALQESWRINHYLRYAGLQLLVVKKFAISDAHDQQVCAMQDECDEDDKDDQKANAKKKGRGAYFSVKLAPHTNERKVANGLHKHRREQLTQNARTDKFRAVIATTPMGKITRYLLQDFMDAMRLDENSASTIHHERSMLRVLFEYAFTKWNWKSLIDNPARKLEMPKVDNERKRLMSDDEKARLDAAIQECRNDMVGPVITLLSETAMRASEPLENARWRDVNWERCLLTLHDPKEGGEAQVALSPVALHALRDLQLLGSDGPNDLIVQITYESLRAAWNRACERAGIENLHLHDLRRTAGTKMALKTGNFFLVKALLRHKTDVMVARYTQVCAADVVDVLHRKEPPMPAPAPAPEVVPAQPAAAAPVLFTMEQVQAMAENAAKMAVALHAQQLQASAVAAQPVVPVPCNVVPLKKVG